MRSPWGCVLILLIQQAFPSFSMAQTLPMEFHGYLRAGAALSSGGGEQVAFQLPGARTKYRLGNESDDWGEFQLDAPLFSDALRGGTFTFHGMLAVGNQGKDLSAAQFWVEGSRLRRGPLEGARFWIGRRYYQRWDVHITDFMFWNNTGLGGGIEDIDLVGLGRLHYAYIQTRIGNRPEYPKTTHEGDMVGSHDLRWSHLQVNDGGFLTLGVDWKQASPRKETQSEDNRHGGLELNLMHDQVDLWGGSNRVAIQWGKGAAATLSNPPDPAKNGDIRTLRLIESLTVQPSTTWSAQFTAVREIRDEASGRTIWTSFGGRPVWHFARHGSLALEVGHDRIEAPSGPARGLTKATLALQLAKGPSFFARPVLRLFVTRAKWNRAAQEAAPASTVLSVSGPFGSRLEGTTFGLHLESWW